MPAVTGADPSWGFHHRLTEIGKIFQNMSQEPRKRTLSVQNIIWGIVPRASPEVFAFGTSFENRSSVILDSRLNTIARFQLLPKTY